MESSKGFFRGSFEGKKECQCFFVCLEFFQLAEAEGSLSSFSSTAVSDFFTLFSLGRNPVLNNLFLLF